jgi:hypothetical protein
MIGQRLLHAVGDLKKAEKADFPDVPAPVDEYCPLQRPPRLMEVNSRTVDAGDLCMEMGDRAEDSSRMQMLRQEGEIVKDSGERYGTPRAQHGWKAAPPSRQQWGESHPVKARALPSRPGANTVSARE